LLSDAIEEANDDPPDSGKVAADFGCVVIATADDWLALPGLDDESGCGLADAEDPGCGLADNVLPLLPDGEDDVTLPVYISRWKLFWSWLNY
jgi:hypothetical protein